LQAPSGSLGRGKQDRLGRHATGIGAEFTTILLRHRVDDPFRLDATSCPDLIDA
jgi:hypothetical protein